MNEVGIVLFERVVLGVEPTIGKTIKTLVDVVENIMVNQAIVDRLKIVLVKDFLIYNI